LENSVRRLRNQPLRTPLEVTVELPYTAYLPREYVPSRRLQIEVYRRLARIRRLERLEDFRQELRDRFGTPPEPVEWLLRLAELRLLAARWHVASIHLEGKGVEGIADFGLRNADSPKLVGSRRVSRDGALGRNGAPAFAKT